MCGREAEIWDLAIEAAARVAAQEWGKKPIVAPLTNAAYDEAARAIEAGIRALKTSEIDNWLAQSLHATEAR